MSRETVERVAGARFFAAFIAAQFTFGIVAAVRVLDVACIVTAAVWFFGRSVPVGVEGRPPSFYLRRGVAVVAAVLMMVLGALLLLYSRQGACVLGWASRPECS